MLDKLLEEKSFVINIVIRSEREEHGSFCLDKTFLQED